MTAFTDYFLKHYIIVISALVTSVFIISSIVKKKFEEGTFIQIVAVFIYAASIISGIKLSIETIAGDANALDEKFLSTVIGGFSLAWIALWEVIKRFKDLNRD